MIILKLLGILIFAIAAVFCIKRMVACIMNIIALNNYRKNPDPLNQRHGMVLNKKTGELEADQSPILPF